MNGERMNGVLNCGGGRRLCLWGWCHFSVVAQLTAVACDIWCCNMEGALHLSMCWMVARYAHMSSPLYPFAVVGAADSMQTHSDPLTGISSPTE